MVYRWNNFIGWFHNGFYRNMENLDGRSIQLINDLDRVLAEQNFDLGQFERLISRKIAFGRAARGFYKRLYQVERREETDKEQQRMDEIGRLEEDLYEQLDVLLEPVARRMMELGYSLEDLIV